MRKVGIALVLSILLVSCANVNKNNSNSTSSQAYNAILVDDNYLLNKYLSENSNVSEEQLNIFLHQALENNSLKSLKTLLDRGANVNFVDVKTGKTPIFYVRSIEALDILISEGAYINIEDSNQELLLAYFIKNKPLDYASFLIEKGANLSSWDILLWAAISGDASLIKQMMKYGANFTQVDTLGNYPIYYAYSEDIILELLNEKNYDLKKTNSKKENVLGEVYLRAVANGYIPVVNKLLKLGVNPYYMSYGDNAISITKNTSNKEMLNFLNSKGIN